MSEVKKTHKQMVRKSLFRTISRNLIRQLCENGFDLVEAVDFVNEILGEVISLGHKCYAGGDITEGRAESAASRSSGDVELLRGEGRVDIGGEAYIRSLAASDCEALRAWEGDEAIAGSLAGAKLQNLLESEGDWDAMREHSDLFAICFKDDDRIVGMLGFTEIDRDTGQAEFGKMIGEPAARGKGLAGKATRTVIDYGFDVLGLNRIYLHTLDGNIKNIRLNQSLGFRFEGLLQQAVQIDGRLRDVAIMALLKRQRRASESSK